ncbi:hypothetical protein QCBJ_17525 [Pseudomonas sp. QC2]|nr:hypothetical protein QCBJ_17525 [Pseudomonas sp. QC2]
MARELAPAGVRSAPVFGAATQPSGGKLPRHKCVGFFRVGFSPSLLARAARRNESGQHVRTGRW